MSGSRYLLDTNALQTADWVGISVISQIEFLAFSRLSQTDRQLFQQFLRRVTALGLTADETLLIQRTVEIRQQSRLKLPDAMIAAMAIENSASLITADREFAKVRDLTIIDW
jgi:tRNA(fMet)-specific endonuclease VapC